MKTLNRPMFRYGGPIKEGIMDGIRENKRQGGSMTQRVQPSNDGSRPGYAGPLLYGLGVGAMAAGRAAMKFIPSVYRGIKAGKYVRGIKPTAKFRQPETPAGQVISGKYKPAALSTREILKSPEMYGRAIRENPGTAITLASLAGSGANKLLGSDKEGGGDGISKINKKKRSIGMPENLTIVNGGQYEKEKQELSEAERIALENKVRREKMEKFKEIMDIKGMSKNAAYKSLVDASKIIQEGGNLKEQLKSGSLIQKVTEAASKRFDKVNDTEAALRSLVVKGEIDNELNKEAKALAKRKDELQIKAYEKQISGKTIQEIRNEKLVRDGELIEGNELASLIRGKTSGKVSPKVLPITGFKVGQDPIEFATSIIMKQNEDETTPDYPEGTYIIKDRVIYVDENGGITPVNDLSGI